MSHINTANESRPYAVTRRAVVAGLCSVVAGLGLAGAAGCSASSSPLGVFEDLMDDARALASTMSSMVDALGTGDFDQAARLAGDFSEQAAALSETLSGGVWKLAAMLPSYGSDVAAVRTLVAALAELSANALVPLTGALASNPPTALFVAQDGGVWVDLASLRALSDALLAAVPHVRAFAEELDGIGELHVDQLADTVESARLAFDQYGGLLDTVEQVVLLLPALLGADGAARTYLLVAQGNSEIRSTGGFPGAIVLIEVLDGSVRLGERLGVSALMPWVANDPLPIDDEERVLFGDRVSYIPGDMGFIPHLPRVAQLWSQCCERSGVPIDGVLTVDPVLLQSLLGLCGSVAMSDGSILDGSSAACLLLRDVYMTYGDNGSMHDAYFSEAVAGATDVLAEALASGTADLGSVAQVLSDGARTRRLGAWFARPEEQEALRALDCGITNELCLDPATPTAGVFFANDTWGKIDWWLDAELHVWEPTADGTVALELRLANTISYDEVAVAPSYVLGRNWERREPGDMMTQLFLYAPAGGSLQIEDPGYGDLSGYVPAFSFDEHMGLEVAHVMLHLLPGESLTVRWQVACVSQAASSDERPAVDLALDVTPTCQGVRIVRG